MSREYLSVLLTAAICVLMSTAASGQPTIDDDGTCDRGLLTSEQVAYLIRKGVQKVVASNQQQPTVHNASCDRDSPTSQQVATLIRKVEEVLASNPQQTTSVDPLKRAIVSALQCEYRFHVINSCLLRPPRR